MSAIDQSSSPAAATTTARYRAAAEAGDVDGVVATLSEDVVLHSPITDRIEFRGHAEMRELLMAVFATINDVHYIADLGDDRNRALFFRGRVGREPVEEAMRIKLDDSGLISEMTLFFRPLPGLATLAGALAPRVVGSRHGPLRALAARVLMAPLAIFTRIGDRLIPFFA